MEPQQRGAERIAQVARVGNDGATDQHPGAGSLEPQQPLARDPGEGSGGHYRDPAHHQAASEVGAEVNAGEIEEDDERDQRVERDHQQPTCPGDSLSGPTALGGYPGAAGDRDRGDDEEDAQRGVILAEAKLTEGGRQRVRRVGRPVDQR
jgi:hypothetical protein